MKGNAYLAGALRSDLALTAAALPAAAVPVLAAVILVCAVFRAEGALLAAAAALSRAVPALVGVTVFAALLSLISAGLADGREDTELSSRRMVRIAAPVLTAGPALCAASGLLHLLPQYVMEPCFMLLAWCTGMAAVTAALLTAAAVLRCAVLDVLPELRMLMRRRGSAHGKASHDTPFL